MSYISVLAYLSAGKQNKKTLNLAQGQHTENRKCPLTRKKKTRSRCSKTCHQSHLSQEQYSYGKTSAISTRAPEIYPDYEEDSLLRIQSLIHKRCNYSQFREPLCKALNSLWTCNQVQEQNSLLRHTSRN